jgi:hypothetical protein
VVPADLSLQDWIAACNKKPSVVGKGDTPLGGGCILAYAPGRLSALLNPRDAVSLNMESLVLLFIADQSQNDSSYRRQNSSDNMKQYEEISLEQPLDIATLLSLAGVGSLVVHRWSTSLTAQKRFVTSFWENFAQKKKDVCSSVAVANSSINANQKLTVITGKGVTTPVATITDDLQSISVCSPGNGIKRWIGLSRTTIGLPSTSYLDN